MIKVIIKRDKMKFLSIVLLYMLSVLWTKMASNIVHINSTHYVKDTMMGQMREVELKKGERCRYVFKKDKMVENIPSKSPLNSVQEL